MHAITPLPPTPGAQGFILVGGTFDPPHRAHVLMAEQARRKLAMSGRWLMFVPAARSPFKAAGGRGATPHDRVRMVELAIAELVDSTVWTDEVDRSSRDEPSYWYQTLERFRSLVGPTCDVRFLVGTDQAIAFHRWREPGRVLELASPIVVPREPVTTAQQLATALGSTGFWSPSEVENWVGRLVDLPVDPASSTRIRDRLGSFESPTSAEELDPRVAAYIQEHGLYRGLRA